MSDEYFMKMALKLATRGRSWASPNPMVGALVVKKGKVIGRGWHRCCGESHAEVNAIADATQSVKDSTLYVTLEPCCHHGKTPPCTDLIIASKIPAMNIIDLSITIIVDTIDRIKTVCPYICD